jgi:hypothetical protein
MGNTMPAATVKVTLAANAWTQIGTAQGLIETNGINPVCIHFGDTVPDINSDAYHLLNSGKSFENGSAIGVWGRAFVATETGSVVFTDTSA